jgi:hypothetical protein
LGGGALGWCVEALSLPWNDANSRAPFPDRTHKPDSFFLTKFECSMQDWMTTKKHQWRLPGYERPRWVGLVGELVDERRVATNVTARVVLHL